MSDLKPAELRIIVEVLDMGAGSCSTSPIVLLQNFFESELRVDIDDGNWRKNGDSKGKRLRSFLQLSDNSVAARALRALADYRAALFTLRGLPITRELDARFQGVVARLESVGGRARTDALDLFSQDDSLEELIAGIERDVAADAPRRLWIGYTHIA